MRTHAKPLWMVLVVVLPTALLACVATDASANQSPRAVASAGVDPNTGQVLNQVTLFIGPADTGIPHTIAGGGSTDPDGDPLTYKWECFNPAVNGKCIFFPVVATNQVNFRPTFPPGTFDITLTVADGQGHTASDSVSVKVQVDMSPPTLTPPDDESVSATEAGGARGAASSELHTFLFSTATAHDNSTAIFTHLPPRVNGVDVDDSTLFPHGTTTVTFRIADYFGNVGIATADVFVTDLQSGDLFVGVLAPNNQGLHKGLVQRIRGGFVTDFCQSPDNGSSRFDDIGDPDFWYQPNKIVVDSKGRVAFLAYLGGEGAPSPQSWGLARCNLPGQPAEKLAIFPQRSYIDPGWPVPLPGRMFSTPGLVPNLPLTGLHLRKVKYVLIDDNSNGGNPQIVTDERYVFGYHESSILDDTTGGTIGNVSVNTKSLDWKENDLSPIAVGFSTTHPQNMLPEMFFHSKTETVSFLGLASFPAPVAKTYVGRFGVLRRILQPLEVQLNTGTVQIGVQAFAGHTEMPNSPIMDDITLPNVFPGCPGEARGWPIRTQPGGGSYTSLQTAGVIFEQNSGLAVNAGGWFGHLDEALFDLDPQNDRQAYFARPETGCRVEPIVDFTPLAGNGVLTSFTSQDGYHFDSIGRSLHPDRMAASPDGLFGTQDGSGDWSGRVVQATGALDLTEVATGLNHPKGLGAFPPQLGNVQLSALIIRIDSPVDVVVTDALGRRVGVLSGQDINEFGSQAHDTGAQTHPRLYIIQHPQPGTYAVRSAGTGSGPFTVHIYSVDSEKQVRQRISHSGDAQPGSAGRHDFELNANRNIVFANASPFAHAGFAQTVDSDFSGNAIVALDGSLSSDPDGDPLTFTWAGPFGIVSGAQVNATLPVGIHALKLTVGDGKGGTAEDIVDITVNPTATPADTTPPALVMPANMTVPATSALGAVVNYSVSASDDVDGPIAPSCVPPSGSNFPVGETTVNCSATDVAGNIGSGTFRVTVTPTSPPATSDGRMSGVGFMNARGVHQHFVFRVSHAGARGYSRLEYWTNDPRRCSDDDDSDRDKDGDGDDDHVYGREHCRPTSRFEAISVTAVAFSDDPAWQPARRNNGRLPLVDTVTLAGVGKWNGKSGYVFEAIATDRGEPGRNRDTFALVVKDARGIVVASVDGVLAGGNIQSTRLAKGTLRKGDAKRK